MATDAEVLGAAYRKENAPNRIERYRPWAWEAYAVGATKDNLKRLIDEGYIIVFAQKPNLTLYLLTEKGKNKGWAESMEHKVTAPALDEVMEQMNLIVGFDDIKLTLANAVSAQRRINFLLEGPPACAKSLMLDAIRRSVRGDYCYEAFGSRTSAAGLSDVLFEKKPKILLLDEADKMRHECYSVLLGLMETGAIIETKNGKIRDEVVDAMVIAACNSSAKMSPEFLSRFAFHPYFPEYTRTEFIDVCVGMLGRTESVPPDIAVLIGSQVYDLGLGDVRKARGVAQLLMEPTAEEVQRVLVMMDKYRLPTTLESKGRRRKHPAQASLPID
jgi:Holliday junction DNA helicase RuvB